jgi:uncharacterized protein (TIGR00255 family)
MALSSMTGFARAQGAAAAYAWSWEVRSVNAKGLDLRLRLPPGWDAIESGLRARAAEMIARGTLHATLNVEREGVAPAVKVNEQVLEAVIATLKSLQGRLDAEPARLDGILGIKGVIEITEADEREEERNAAQAAVVQGFDLALASLVTMRRNEGEALGRVLGARLTEISALIARAEASPGRQPEAIRARLAEQVTALIETSDRFDPDRLHQEAILIATRADVREELDRLTAHVAAAAKMIRDGGAVGRRLDFLAQELNRETNTLCAKAGDLELTNIGLELKGLVEQFREQVQNLE